MRKGCFIVAAILFVLIAFTIGVGGYVGHVYDQRRDADLAILQNVNLTSGILSRKGYVYHIIFSPPFNARFRDRDLRHLAEIKHLEIIWVEDLPLTDRSLEELARLTNLRYLGLYNTNVTDEGVDRLRKSLFQTEIMVTRPRPTQND